MLNLTFLLALLPVILGVDVNYSFNVQNTNLAPDGFTRSTVVVNGALPGTLIMANKTDTPGPKIVSTTSSLIPP